MPSHSFWNAQYMMGLLSLGAFNTEESRYSVDLVKAQEWFKSGMDNRDPASAYHYFAISLQLASVLEAVPINEVKPDIMRFSQHIANTPNARDLKKLFVKTVIETESDEYVREALAAAEY